MERVVGREASVAPAVASGGGGAGRVEGGTLKDGDLSLGFGYTSRVPVTLSEAGPPGHAGLWGRPTGYGFREAGATLGVGLAGTQREIFRDILARGGEDFGPGSASTYAEALKREGERAEQQANYGDAGRGEERDSSSSGSVGKAHPQGTEVEPWAPPLRDDVVRGMDVQALNESRPPQHNPQAVGDVDAVHQVHLHGTHWHFPFLPFPHICSGGSSHLANSAAA